MNNTRTKSFLLPLFLFSVHLKGTRCEIPYKIGLGLIQQATVYATPIQYLSQLHCLLYPCVELFSFQLFGADSSSQTEEKVLCHCLTGAVCLLITETLFIYVHTPFVMCVQKKPNQPTRDNTLLFCNSSECNQLHTQFSY